MERRLKPLAPQPNRPFGQPVSLCDVCGGPTHELHCKIICRNCGYTRDCSDP